MIVDYEFKAGLVFGLEADELILYNEETGETADEPSSVIYIHLGLITLALIFGV